MQGERPHHKYKADETQVLFMSAIFGTPLFVFEMANNHMGDAGHGLRTRRELAASRRISFKFAVKMQYRNLDAMIHPDFAARTDIKYIKLFTETRLSREDTRRLAAEIKAQGFAAMCTPFGNEPVDLIVEDGGGILKIASCCLTGWPPLERMAQADLPVITSTHEGPALTLPVGLAIAKGARIFGKHAGVAAEKYALNAYSATPAQIRAWLEAAVQAYAVCGIKGERLRPSEEESGCLFALRRGVYAKQRIEAGERITDAGVFFAVPAQPGRLTANGRSKCNHFHAAETIEPGAPVPAGNTRRISTRETVDQIGRRVTALLRTGNIVVPGHAAMEISHHYGLERFDEYRITAINREYCKKPIVVLPGQKHPAPHHEHKEETFHVLHGSLSLTLDGMTRDCGPGEAAVAGRGVHHAVESAGGAVFEEISSTHHLADSCHLDTEIGRSPGASVRHSGDEDPGRGGAAGRHPRNTGTSWGISPRRRQTRPYGRNRRRSRSRTGR
jgi:sialic acid synthase SpsE/mannose-6-phosphate isomerase-like protein (cupin superfamily)